MTPAALAFVLAFSFSSAWADVQARYDVPEAVIEVRDLGGDGLAQHMDDFPGHVALDPDLLLWGEEYMRKVAAHEAFHAMLRARGVPYMNQWEEQLANTFAYCFAQIDHYGLTDCETVLSVRW